MSFETVVFGGGCFWCTEAVFSQLKGINSVLPGYAGGTVENPSYYDVVDGETGHAEVIKIEYDPKVIPFKTLLEVFWATHNPTTLNQQDYDKGTEYRSIILYTTDEQKKDAEESMKEEQEHIGEGRPIVTEIKKLDTFYTAEEYHHKYFERNEGAPYCSIIISPKIQKLKEKFAHLLK